jgi:hypothetical protein
LGITKSVVLSPCTFTWAWGFPTLVFWKGLGVKTSVLRVVKDLSFILIGGHTTITIIAGYLLRVGVRYFRNGLFQRFLFE